MQGNYFSWLSHDDIYAPEKLQEQITYLSGVDESIRSSVIVYSDFSVFTKSIEQQVPIASEKVFPENFQFWLAKDSKLHGCTLLIPRESLLNSGGFDESLSTTQDYELWFRLAKVNQFHQIKKNLLFSRLHNKQNSVTSKDIARTECKKLYAEFVVEIGHKNLSELAKQDYFIEYLQLTISMLRRGFYKASYLSLGLTLRSFSHTSWLSRRMAIKIVIKELMFYPVKIIAQRIPQQIRSRIKNILYSFVSGCD